MMDYPLKQLFILIRQTFNRLSGIVVIFQIVSGIALLVFGYMKENDPIKDFYCVVKLSDKDFIQGKCFDKYEELHNKFSFPVYGFVLANFAVNCFVCAIYSGCVMSTVNKLEKSDGNGDAEGECTDSEKASLIHRGPSKTLFMVYCVQLVFRVALGIISIILQIVVLYPRRLASNFVCNLGEEVNHNKPNSPANVTQTQTEIYKCHNRRAHMKNRWITAVAVLNGIFAFLVCIEIVYILFRALKNAEFMGNKQFCSDHLRNPGSKGQQFR